MAPAPSPTTTPGTSFSRLLGVQGVLEELGTPLAEATFVVVDLETTGGSAASCSITEIGAVKVRGGDVLGELQTLVRPDSPIPAFISVLTGITDAMVAAAPRIGAALPAFLEFARGAVLVAHNAPFDVGFLRAAATSLGLVWPGFPVVDTARLARRVVTRDESPDCRLSSLARVFHASTVPVHRALADARATVDVLHGLLERLGNQGVRTVEELALWQSAVTAAQRRKRSLAEAVPHAPGVYLFADARGRILYVGKSTDLRTRVRTYFTAAETRRRMHEMVGLAESVTPLVCATGLEAEVRELRLIAEHKPRYNRRSKYPERSVWLKLTVEPFPRLSLVRELRADDTVYLGPFPHRRAAEQAAAAVHEALPLRQCTMSLSPRRPRPACVLAELHRCLAPCTGAVPVQVYAGQVDLLREAVQQRTGPLLERLLRRIERLAAQERYEEALVHRDRTASLVRGIDRVQRLTRLGAVRELVAARRLAAGGWEVHVVRHGRLAGACAVPPGAHPRPWVDAALAAAETVRPVPPPLPACSTDEAEVVLRWLDQPGVRLVELDGSWSCPAGSAAAHGPIGPAGSPGAGEPYPDRRHRRGLRTLGAGSPSRPAGTADLPVAGTTLAAPPARRRPPA